eukprot:TRINITY_DN21354_c0_g1_i1.p1 TRINITY_DN21354_c0_g1~~TRINITY_DN21354_c0_g1_i1.p1  ORF type:complete len:1412 (-),score=230.39 TRINITY_DN21354_c0_g1_i1:301-4449(-)
MVASLADVADEDREAPLPPWVAAQLYLRKRRRRPEKSSPLLRKRELPPVIAADSDAAPGGEPAPPPQLPITSVRAITASTSAPALQLDADFAQTEGDDAEGEHLVRQVALVRQAANRRAALGRSMMLPPPCDDVYLKLPAELQPKVDELLAHMRKDKTNHRTAMARTLLCIRPPMNANRFPPPPLQHRANARLDVATTTATLALSEESACAHELDVLVWMDQVQDAARFPKAGRRNASGTAATDTQATETPSNPMRKAIGLMSQENRSLDVSTSLSRKITAQESRSFDAPMPWPVNTPSRKIPGRRSGLETPTTPLRRVVTEVRLTEDIRSIGQRSAGDIASPESPPSRSRIRSGGFETPTTPLRRAATCVEARPTEDVRSIGQRTMDAEEFWRYLETRYHSENPNPANITSAGRSRPTTGGAGVVAGNARPASVSRLPTRPQSTASACGLAAPFSSQSSMSGVSGILSLSNIDVSTDPRWVAAAMLCFPMVVDLSFSDLPVSADCLAFAPCWRHLRTLRLSGCVTLVSEDLAALAGCVSLEMLVVSHCASLETLMHLEGLPKLRHIDARNCLSFGRDVPSPTPTTRSLVNTPSGTRLPGKSFDEKEDPVGQWLSDTDPSRKMRTLHTMGVVAKAAKAMVSRKGLVKTVTLVALPTLREIDLQGCAGVQVLKVRLAAVESLDLSWLPSLLRLEGRLAGLLRLDMSYCGNLKQLPTSFFKMINQLQELSACGCDALTHIRGINCAKSLRRLRLARCPSLVALEGKDDAMIERSRTMFPASDAPKGVTSKLTYLDVSGCTALPKEHLRAYVGDQVAAWLNNLGQDCGAADADDCIGYRLLHAEATPEGSVLESGERCEIVDFWKAEGLEASFRANFRSLGSTSTPRASGSQPSTTPRGTRPAPLEDCEKSEDRPPQYVYRLSSRRTGECLEVPSSLDGEVFEAEPPDEVEEDSARPGVLVVWPSYEYGVDMLSTLLEESDLAESTDALNTPKTVSKGSARRRVGEMSGDSSGDSTERTQGPSHTPLRMAARMKLCEAISTGRSVAAAPEDSVMDSDGWRERAINELIDALRLIDELNIGGRVEDFPLLHAGMQLAHTFQVSDQLPEGIVKKGRRERILRTVNLIIPMIGSGPALMVSRASQRVAGATAAAYSRPIRARIDVGVDEDNTEEFALAVDRVKQAARAWDGRTLRNAWAKFEEVAEKKAVVGLAGAVQERLKILEEKFRIVNAVLKKGWVEIDFQECKISTAVPLKFAPRAPPDTSAEFDQELAGDVAETLRDLAVILEAYLQPMVVEGRTGGSDPYAFWLELAHNRSRLIISYLENQCGLPVGLLVPAGEPGGGAKVLVYPFDQEEMERRRLSQRHRPKARNAAPAADPKDKKKKGK